MQVSPIMLMECVKTATTLRVEPRKPSIVNTMIEHYMPKDSVRIATYLSTINVRGTHVRKVMTRKALINLNNEIPSCLLLRMT